MVVGKHGPLAFRQPFDEGGGQQQPPVATLLRWRMATAAYQCTVAMVLRTQTNPDTVAKLLGPDPKAMRTPTHGAAFLQHIVDRRRVHVFAPWEVRGDVMYACMRRRVLHGWTARGIARRRTDDDRLGPAQTKQTNQSSREPTGTCPTAGVEAAAPGAPSAFAFSSAARRHVVEFMPWLCLLTIRPWAG